LNVEENLKKVEKTALAQNSSYNSNKNASDNFLEKSNKKFKPTKNLSE
jgi:hypothetical protein